MPGKRTACFREQEFRGMVGSYLAHNAGRRGPPFRTIEILDGREYLCRQDADDPHIPFPVGTKTGLFLPRDYEQAIALLESNPALSVFPKLILETRMKVSYIRKDKVDAQIITGQRVDEPDELVYVGVRCRPGTEWFEELRYALHHAALEKNKAWVDHLFSPAK